MGLLNLLTAYQKKHLVEFLPYHECDTQSRQAPDLDCLIKLQAQHTQQRHLIFLTGNLTLPPLPPKKITFPHASLTLYYCCVSKCLLLTENAHFYRETVRDVPAVLQKWNRDSEHRRYYERFPQSHWIH